MTITVDYPMLEKLRKDIIHSEKIKDRLFKEFISWYFMPMTSSHFTSTNMTKYVFHELNRKLEHNFEDIVSEFLRENYKEEE
tara:strand:+ start:435 stop:680 length:246 start_codon:yes stop_codon:yes gene_type:complete